MLYAEFAFLSVSQLPQSIQEHIPSFRFVTKTKSPILDLEKLIVSLILDVDKCLFFLFLEDCRDEQKLSGFIEHQLFINHGDGKTLSADRDFRTSEDKVRTLMRIVSESEVSVNRRELTETYVISR